MHWRKRKSLSLPPVLVPAVKKMASSTLHAMNVEDKIAKCAVRISLDEKQYDGGSRAIFNRVPPAISKIYQSDVRKDEEIGI